MMTSTTRRGRAVASLAAVLLLVGAGIAEARAGRGNSFGSRGSRSSDDAPVTRTAPAPAQPLPRTQAPGPTAQPSPGLRQPGAVAAQPARRFGTGFFAGLLGAGLLGALFGAGFFGGLGSLTAILGLLLQAALIAGVVVLAVRFFRSRRQQPAHAAALSGHQRQGMTPTGPVGGGLGGGMAGGPVGGGMTGGLGAGLGGGAPRRRERSDTVGIGPADYEAFEGLLVGVQAAYSREDVAALRRLATPEMVSYFSEQIVENARTPTRIEVTDVALNQGDLAEAWRDADGDYATVAMRFGFVERVIDRASNRPVEGGGPSEATELWTFRRVPGGPWQLSAIQQA